MSTELMFNIDGFGNAKKITGNEAVSHQLLNLITLKKNYDPLNPDKGIDIYSWFPMTDESGNLSELKNDIFNQIEKYTPYVPSNIAVSSQGKFIIIVIQLQNSNEIYYFASNGTKTILDTFKES